MQLTEQELIDSLRRAIVIANYRLVIAKYYGFTDAIKEHRENALEYLSRIFILQNLNNCNISKDLYCKFSEIKKEYMNLCNESSGAELQAEIEALIESKLAETIPCSATVCADVDLLKTKVTALEADDCCDVLSGQVDALDAGLTSQGIRITDLEVGLDAQGERITDLETLLPINNVVIQPLSLTFAGETQLIEFTTNQLVDIDGNITFSITGEVAI